MHRLSIRYRRSRQYLYSSHFQATDGTLSLLELRHRRPAALSPDAPRDAVAARDTGDLPAQMALQHGPPRYQCELEGFLDDREPAAREIDVPAVDTFHPFPRLGLFVAQPRLAR